jgi:ring-1,2-phenylacetyl-CoA epoxidase subunit PaaD
MVSHDLTDAAAWDVLDAVPDPELPAVSVCDLGIVREVHANGDEVTVVVTPTYSGCPATEFIESGIREALMAAGAARVNVRTRLSPAWTSDWIRPTARDKLLTHGVVPPAPAGAAQPLTFMPRRLNCPRCGSDRTTRISQFGSTACKALYRCDTCQEPFEYFKEI